MDLERSLYITFSVPLCLKCVCCNITCCSLIFIRTVFLGSSRFPELEHHRFALTLNSCPKNQCYFFLCRKSRLVAALGEYILTLLSYPKAVSRVTLCNGINIVFHVLTLSSPSLLLLSPAFIHSANASSSP